MMELNNIFNKIEELNNKILSLNLDLEVKIEKLWDKETDLIHVENEIIFNSADYAELKNEKQRTAYIKEETLSENYEILIAKKDINELKHKIDFYKNQLRMYNRMLDNHFYNGD